MRILYIIIILFFSSGFTMTRAQVVNHPELPKDCILTILSLLDSSSFDEKPYIDLETLQNFLSRNIIYPKEAEAKKISGEVTVVFVVEKDGTLSNFSTLIQIPYLSDEAMRVAKILPLFKPATLKGEPVRCKMKLPIVFNLE